MKQSTYFKEMKANCRKYCLEMFGKYLMFAEDLRDYCHRNRVHSHGFAPKQTKIYLYLLKPLSINISCLFAARRR